MSTRKWLIRNSAQATPGRTFCRVAMRLQGESVADLPAAHERAGS